MISLKLYLVSSHSALHTYFLVLLLGSVVNGDKLEELVQTMSLKVKNSC